MNGSPSAIRRARAVFQCALELDGDERQEFVQDACAGDDELSGPDGGEEESVIVFSALLPLFLSV